MKKRAKPIKDWDNVVEVSIKEKIVDPETKKTSYRTVRLFPTEEYKPILERLEIPLTDKNLKDIIKAQEYYYAAHRIHNEGPTMSEVCAAMRQLIKYSERYSSCLKHLDDKSRLKLAVVVEIPLMFDERFERAQDDAYFISRRATQVLEDWELQKKTYKIGAPEDFALKTYIQMLIDIYERETGKKTTLTKDSAQLSDGIFKGPFMEFFEYCFERVPGHPQLTNNAKGKTIMRAIAAKIKIKYP